MPYIVLGILLAMTGLVGLAALSFEVTKSELDNVLMYPRALSQPNLEQIAENAPALIDKEYTV